MTKRVISLSVMLFLFAAGSGQEGNYPDRKILLRGIVKDASSESPLFNTQIFVNHNFITSTDSSGTFSFRITRNDSVLFRNLGYKPTLLRITDTLAMNEVMAGVYMTSDTIMIGEVIIIPKRPNFRSEILNAPVASTPERENAKYNMQVAAYQGKVAQGKLDDPASNYGVIRGQLSQAARERGQISSNQMVAVSPLVVIPLAYMIIKGMPGKPEPLVPDLTKEELDQIHRKYMESQRSRK
jgi:hypothetical protein